MFTHLYGNNEKHKSVFFFQTLFDYLRQQTTFYGWSHQHTVLARPVYSMHIRLPPRANFDVPQV